MAQKTSIPKGTRDFTPAEMVRRNYIFDTVKAVFQRYGFLPIETPAMENLSTLMGKYGEEGDKLLFKILNSGDFLSDFDEKQREIIENLVRMKKEFLSKVITNKNKSEVLNILKNRSTDSETKNVIDDIVIQNLLLEEILIEGENGEFRLGSQTKEKDLKKEVQRILDTTFNEFLKKKIVDYVGKEKGLRYDLTVPFARFVVQHQSEITFPFKRYQIQPVWRADRPQKGRYREFFQCDVDVVGSDSLLNEVELIQIVDEVYRRLNINVVLKINNRKILAGIAQTIGQPERIVDITVAIDKLDKIGLEKVNEELVDKGLPQSAIDQLQPIIQLAGTNAEKLDVLRTVIAPSYNSENIEKEDAIGLKGIEEVETILNYLAAIGINLDVELDLTLARGLNYYTGAIFEVKAKDVAIGSITGGGRYDDLTGIFGLKDVSGVGISFGADRIYDVMTQLNLFPDNHQATTKVLFVNFGKKEELHCLTLLQQVRAAGINAELYPEQDKMKKQMGYADKKQIPYVAIIGEDEMNQHKITLKSMASGEQQLVDIQGVIDVIGG